MQVNCPFGSSIHLSMTTPPEPSRLPKPIEAVRVILGYRRYVYHGHAHTRSVVSSVGTRATVLIPVHV